MSQLHARQAFPRVCALCVALVQRQLASSTPMFASSSSYTQLPKHPTCCLCPFIILRKHRLGMPVSKWAVVMVVLLVAEARRPQRICLSIWISNPAAVGNMPWGVAQAAVIMASLALLVRCIVFVAACCVYSGAVAGLPALLHAIGGPPRWRGANATAHASRACCACQPNGWTDCLWNALL